MLRSTELPRWLLLAGLLCCSSCQSVPFSFENKTGGQNDSRPRIFSPRMDYDEWTPLGRGDPLKNNPTYDYVPPVLDRVQYWLDSQQHTTEPSSKRDILVLGVTAKKTSPKIPEQFLKFVDGPKLTRTGGQVDAASYRNDFTGSTGAEPPKVLRTTSFRNGLVDYRSQNSLQSLPASYYPSPYYSQKMKPYTMMMPPPLVQKAETSTGYNVGAYKDKLIGYVDASVPPYSTQTEEGPVLQDTQYYGAPSKNYGYYSSAPFSRPFSTSKAPPSKLEIVKSAPSASQSTKTRYEATTAAPSVSFEKSNLIYQSTQTLSGGWLVNNGPTSSTGFPPANQVTWQTPDYSRDHYEVDHHTAASSNHEVVVGQNANIIVDVNGNENEEVVVGQKEVSTEATSSTSESVTQTSAASTTTTDSGVREEEEEEEAVTDAQTSQKMHIVVANSPSSSTMDLETHKAKKGPVSVVLPTNYVERNSSSAMTFHGDAWEDPATSEMTKTTHQAGKSQPQPARNAATSSPPPIPTEDRFTVSSVPNRMLSQITHQPSHPPSASVMPTRQHVGAGPHMFVPPQAASQSVVRPQSRPNHAMMHLIGSMRPGFRPSPPASMSHMSPPMAHMHSQPMKSMIAPSPSMEQLHQRPLPQLFPVTFTNPPSTLGTHATGPDEQPIDPHRSSRPPATIVRPSASTTAPSFAPTAASAVEYTSTMGTVDHRESTRTDRSPLVKILNAEEMPRTTPAAPSSTIPPRTTTPPSLTTDPIFSHYKQPAKPIRGPMYLIIQGHSKVKTYGPTIAKHDAPVENNEIAESATERQLSKLEQLIHDNTKNGAVDLAAEKRKLEEKARAEKLVSSRPETLMSLVESGLSGFTVSPATEDERRASNSVTSIEIN
ncbi:mucin-4 [Linepithema humile]|uniref:mucin-4 n=1 Tax=Linepithema humile TaxID=83485 RepID=UPI00351EF5D1